MGYNTDVGSSGGGTAATTTFTPDGDIAATNVQDAIVEVRNEAKIEIDENNGLVTLDPSVLNFKGGFDLGLAGSTVGIDLDASEVQGTPVLVSGSTSAAGGSTFFADAQHQHGLDVGTNLLVAPTVRSIGASSSGTGAVVANLPAGHANNDILLLFVQSSNQGVATPAGYSQLGPQQGVGTAGAAASTRLATFWKRDNGAEVAPTVADTGDHTFVVMAAIQGGEQQAVDPFVFLNSGRKATASVTALGNAGEVSIDNVLLIGAFAHAVDSATAQASSPSGTAVTLTEQFDAGTTDGNGGGIVIYSSTAPGAARTTGNITHTWANSTADVWTWFAIVPNNARNIADSPRAAEVQTFLTAGTDTWTKPSGAKAVEIIAIGGGGAGGAGRSAATAAGGGGGGGGAYCRKIFRSAELQSTCTIVVGSGGVGGATNSNGIASTVTDNTLVIVNSGPGSNGTAGASANGGQGAFGGSVGPLVQAAGAAQGTGGSGGGTQGTDGQAGQISDMGGAGGGGGNVAAGAGGAGGASAYGGGGGGGGTVSLAGGAGGVGGSGVAGGISKGGSATTGSVMTVGSSGGAGGSDSPTAGGNGAQPGGGGGGGGNATASGGNGGDGAVTIITYF